jgi:hypothetical protein
MGGPAQLPDQRAQNMEDLLHALLVKFAWWHRSGSPWIVTSGAGVAIAGGAAGVVCTYPVPENQDAVLMRIGWGVAPAGALVTTGWTLRLGGAGHFGFTERIFNFANLATPLEFPIALRGGTVVDLFARNGAFGGIVVDGHLDGFIVLDKENVV